MTFSSRENSVDSGAPVELYLWTIPGAFASWRFTNSDTARTHLGQMYTPAAISSSNSEASAEIEKSSLTVTAPRDFPLSDLYLSSSPAGVVSLTVFREHDGDGEWIVWWKGRVVNAAFQGDTVELTHESVYSSLARPGLNRKYQAGCSHVLYGSECGVSRATHKRTHPVLTVTGNVVALNGASYAANWFAGGYIEYLDPITGATARRFITESTTDGVLTLASFPFGLTVDALVDAYPGCDRLLATCHTKFSNVRNYGGMPYIPKGENPFAGTRVL